MFRVEQNVPEVYINESRDFQLFSRLYDLVFQSSRFSIDSMEQSSDTLHCNDKLLPLIATKVGFFTDLNLTSYADRLILTAFPYIIRYKGCLEGIELVANLFERIMNISVEVNTEKLVQESKIIIEFHDYTPNVDLLYALLSYIRPTGLVIEYSVITEFPKAVHNVSYSDNVTFRTGMLEASENTSTESAVVVQDVANYRNYSDVASNIGFTQIQRSKIK